MKRICLILLLIVVLFVVSGCNSSTKWTDDINSFEEFSMRLESLAEYGELDLDIRTSDLSVTSLDDAFCYLDMYLSGDYFPKRQLRDSLEYIERYIDAVDKETQELNKLFNKIF